MSDVTSETVTSGTVTQASSGATTETSGSVANNQQKNDSASSDHAMKLKKELDNWRSKAKELQEKMDLAEGNKDKVIEGLREELTTMKKTQAEMLRSKVRDQIAVKASEMGCLNPDLMLKAIEVDSFEVDAGTLRITDQERLMKTVEEFKKTNPYMFKQSGPSVKDGVPGAKPGTKLDLAKMSKAELVEYAKSKGIT